VVGKYGSEYRRNGTAIEYIMGNVMLMFDMKDGKVAAIVYQYK